MRKSLAKTLMLLTFLGSILFFSNIRAYSPTYTHPDLSEESLKFYNSSFQKPVPTGALEIIRKGTMEEDLEPRWINHFYDPTTGEGWTGEHWGAHDKATIQNSIFNLISISQKPLSSPSWAESSAVQLKFSLYGGDHSWQKAVHDYAGGNENAGLESLGHILHLIQDTTVPDHTRNDSHPHIAGDPGSPYEEWVERYTNSKKIQTASELLKSSTQMPVFNSLRDAFEYTAKYSNENFFSEETIGDPKYHLPVISGREEINNNSYFYSFISNQKIYLYKIPRDKEITTVNDPKILGPYFDLLSKRAVLAGAGVMDLFFREVEKVKKDKEAVPSPVVLSRTEIFASSIVSPIGEGFRIVHAYAGAKKTVQMVISGVKSTAGNIITNITNALNLTDTQKQLQTAGLVSLQNTNANQNPIVQNPQTNPLVESPPNTAAVQNPIVPKATVKTATDNPSPPNVPKNPLTPLPKVFPIFPGFGGGSTKNIDEELPAPVNVPAPNDSEILAADSSSTTSASGLPSTTLAINEIAWQGTYSSSTDYWIELHNFGTTSAISLDGWILSSSGGSLSVPLTGSISSGGYYLIEWNSDNVVSDAPADFILQAAPNLKSLLGEKLILQSGTTTIDETPAYGDSWVDLGSASSIERVNPASSGADENNWLTPDDFFSANSDSSGGRILGTPRLRNGRNYLINGGRGISSPVELSSANSPYYILRPLDVTFSGSLVVQPNVTIYFYDSSRRISGCACLHAFGKVVIGAESGGQVHLEGISRETDSVPSGGIVFYSGSEGSEINNVAINNFRRGLVIHGSNVSISNISARDWEDSLDVISSGTLFLNNSSLRGFWRDGIYVDASSTATVSNSSLSNFLSGDAISAYNNSLVNLRGVIVSNIGNGSAVGTYNSRANIENSSFRGGLDDALEFYSSPDVLINNILVKDFLGTGISSYDSAVAISSSESSANDVGLDFYGASIVLAGNSFANNLSYGFYNGSGRTTPAKNLWWGDASGPYHGTLNPSGLGNTVSDDVDFSLWSLNENFSAFSVSTTSAPFVDTTPPEVHGFSVSACSYSLRTDGGCLITQNPVRLAWASDSSDVSYYEIIASSSSETILATTTSLTADITLGEGIHNLLIRAVDTSDNHGDSVVLTLEYRLSPIVINEIAWAGAGATTTSDEWIELKNATAYNLSLSSFVLFASDGAPYLRLSGNISADGFYLIERTDDNTISNITADLTTAFSGSGGSGLSNSGEVLNLTFAPTGIATSTLDVTPAISACHPPTGGWCGGSASPHYYSMERISANVSGATASNWGNNDGITINGLSAGGFLVNGTPKAENSISSL